MSFMDELPFDILGKTSDALCIVFIILGAADSYDMNYICYMTGLACYDTL